VHSVTSEPATSALFQGAPPPRSGKSDPKPGNDSFAALVESSKPVDSSPDRAPDLPRRSDDAPVTAGSQRSRDTNDKATRDASDDRAAAFRQRPDAGANDDAVQHSRAKSGDTKPESPKSTDKPSDDAPPKAASVADRAEQAQPEAPVAKAPDPVAAPVAVVAVAAVAANVVAATPATNGATSPLAIAAAAIAASTAVTDLPAVTPVQAGVDPDAAATTTPDAKVAVQVAASEKTAALNQLATTTDTDTAAATDGVFAAMVASAKPAAAKATPAKVAVTVPGATTASSESDSAAGTIDATAPATSTALPVASATAEPAATARPKAGNGPVEAAKSEGSAGSSPAAGGLAHAAREVAPPPTAALDAAIPAPDAVQSHLHSVAATASAGALTAAAATSDAVPLNGLAVEIAARARSGNTHFEIRLDPADLGRIDVRIDIDRNGHVTSHLMVEKPETLSMLRQDAPQLQRALDDAGFRTADSGLQFSLRDQNSSGQNNDSGSGQKAQRVIVSEEDIIPAVVAGRSYGRTLGSSSGVDIKV